VTEKTFSSVHERWAHLRLAVIGQLLAAPPRKGMLRAELQRLAAREWRHPISGKPVRFGFSTLERWFATARKAQRDPVGALRRKVRKDLGTQGSMSMALRQAMQAQYANHPSWSVELHHQNLRALATQHLDLGAVPSYSTVRRYCKTHGLHKRRRLTSRKTAGAERAEARLAAREVRSYEAEYCSGLWHLDCHEGSRKVLTPRGEWATPLLFGVIDDRSRLACHLQWYLGAERTQIVVHGLSQAFMRRGLCRAAMSDNGSANLAAEMTEGLARLSITHDTTLAYSPYMNGKIECLWAQVEGRLMAMLEGVDDLTLATLNEATQAWVQYDYNRELHSEIGQPPLDRWLAGPDVSRPCPDSATLRLAFTQTDRRTQRLSDGTVVIDTRRFEVPNRFRHLSRIQLRYARWDLTQVHMVDERTDEVLCRLFPQDKTLNANGVRRTLEPLGTAPPVDPAAAKRAAGIAPLLAQFMAQQSATGLPPAYLPTPDDLPPDEGANS
jgi:putative transposase